MTVAKKSKRKKTIRRPMVVRERRFAPKPCTNCKELIPKNKNYSEVYSTFSRTDGTYRYCRCTFCGNTWKSFDRHE